jgi:hypothetical protein
MILEKTVIISQYRTKQNNLDSFGLFTVWIGVNPVYNSVLYLSI